MRAALYGRHLGRSVRTGIEVYAEGIIGKLLSIDEDWVLVCTAGLQSWPHPAGNHQTFRLKTSSSFLPLITEIGLLLKREKCDVFYNPAQYAPMYSPCPVVMTALDVAWRYYPDYFPPSKRLAFDLLTSFACRKADRIIAISESTRNDLIRHYHCSPDKIVVAYPGVDHAEFNPVRTKDEEILIKHGLHRGNYILYLGTLQKRKNLIRLVRAYGRMKKNGMPLVLAGGKGWYYHEIAEAIAQCPRSDEIIEIGYVEPQERSVLYRNAICTAYLSLYEGFGFPVAEAMACGCPPLVSRTSSLPEVAGNVGWQVDPTNEEEIANALNLATIEGMNPELRASASERSKRFEWAESARIVHDAILSVSD